MALPLAIVSGASSGIGASCALRLAPEFDLLILGRDKERLERTARRCRAETSSKVRAISGDLTTEEHIEEIAAYVNHGTGGVECLVNNAGFGIFGSFFDLTTQDFRSVLETNLTSVFRLSRTIAPHMAKRGRGTIVNISSDADATGFPDAHAYCASKGGLAMLSRAMQTELRPLGIRVNIVSPGRVDTHFNGKAPGMRKGALTADEVAEVVQFLVCCSPNIEVEHLRVESMSRS